MNQRMTQRNFEGTTFNNVNANTPKNECKNVEADIPTEILEASGRIPWSVVSQTQPTFFLINWYVKEGPQSTSGYIYHGGLMIDEIHWPLTYPSNLVYIWALICDFCWVRKNCESFSAKLLFWCVWRSRKLWPWICLASASWSWEAF